MASPETYLSFDVLVADDPNLRDGIGESFERYGEMIDGGTGRRRFDDFAGVAIPRRTFSWFADGREGIADLRTFIMIRKGRLIPFWTPTYLADLQMTQDQVAIDSSIRVWNVGYGEKLFSHNSRKHIALIKPDGEFLIRKITTVVDNGDETETLTLESGLGEDLAAATTMVSFLVICRLEIDRPAIRYSNPEHGEAEIPFREIPREAPA